ncbi:MAG TPA: 3-methyladenine DNA glycosylase [Candidatus Ruania gallistercoris]|uniref:3-methyladenine DNA glycosylase n=1 Tax=Candidatus Ruania gallistercoris TaxID=2838746 RepID=A0A9D2J3D7_9MICO|nr:3-methyladenine DNA glycosylase [Candidatus Ruania gallistercoris]
MTAPVSSAVVLAEETWRERERVHAQQADTLTAAHRERRQSGAAHPVEDFLFTYYPTRPAQLRRWHPGGAVLLAGAAERAGWRWYRVDESGRASLDAAAFLADRGEGVTWARELLEGTLSRPARYTCFGLHEWAMVYRTSDVRHEQVPLRLGAEGTDAVVRAHPLRCTHFDAFRFFTDDAAPRNERPLDRASQLQVEQPGCLHANMDCYRIAMKLGPVVPGELLLDCFELARDIRELDMRASPYDLRDWGYQPVPIETPEGKATYVAAQREFTRRSNGLRDRLLAAIAALQAPPGTGHRI